MIERRGCKVGGWGTSLGLGFSSRSSAWRKALRVERGGGLEHHQELKTEAVTLALECKQQAKRQ